MPSRIVPPISATRRWSGMRSITGFTESGSNSVELALVKPATFRAISITINCIPKHRPRYGTFFSRAYWAAEIIPSIPLEPNPPGTTIPHAYSRNLSGPSFSIISDGIQFKRTARSCPSAAWFKASLTEIYASGKSAYLPTIAISIGFLGVFILSTRLLHFSKWRTFLGRFNELIILSPIPACESINGTSYIVSTVCKAITLSWSTSQKRAIFSLMSSGTNSSHLQIIQSGWIPILRSSFTLCWVGFVFNSPVEDILGRRVTWM